MKSLNSLWITLMAAGVIALIFAVGIRLFETSTGANSTDFNGRVTPISSSPLITPDIEEHLTE